MKARFEAAHGSQIQRKKIEEQSAVCFGGERHHFALLVLARMVVDPLEVRGLSAQTWTVVNELAVNFARRKIDERHLFSTRKFGHKLIAYAVLAGQHSGCACPLSGNLLTVSVKRRLFRCFFSRFAAGR